MGNVVWREQRASVAIVASVPLIASAVVVFGGEVIIEVTVAHVVPIVGGLLATREGSEGVTVVVGLFVHESIIRGQGSRSPPLVDSSKFVQHLLHLCCVDVWRVVGETVARLGDTMEHQQIDAVLPGIGTASDVVEELVILQPQGSIPGLPVCPSVECGVGHVFV